MNTKVIHEKIFDVNKVIISIMYKEFQISNIMPCIYSGNLWLLPESIYSSFPENL